MAAPRPVLDPVTSAFLPLRLKVSWIKRFLLRAALFQARAALAKASLDIHHAELAIFLLTMRRHSPQKANRMSGNRNIGVITAGHQDCIAVANYSDQLR